MSLFPTGAPNPQNTYPKTKYGAGGGSITVESHHQEFLLGPGWSDNPPPEPEPVAPVVPDAKVPSKKAKIETGGGATWPA